MAMIGNLQRKDMNPVEAGMAYAKMMKAGKSFKAVSEIYGVSDFTVRTMVAIIELEPEIQELYVLGQLPVTWQVVAAFKRLPDEVRVAVVRGFARRGTSIRGILQWCARVSKNNGQVTERQTRNLVNVPDDPGLDIPGFIVSRKREKDVIDTDHWDALHQAGHVPAWDTFTGAIREACVRCVLHDAANFTTCKDCPLVDLIGILKDRVNEKGGK
jgi:hypothetical protein